MFSERAVRVTLARTLAALLLTLTSIAPAMAEAPRCPDVNELPPVVHFNAGSFSNPTRISNVWLPLALGTRLILEGTANRRDEKAFPIAWSAPLPTLRR